MFCLAVRFCDIFFELVEESEVGDDPLAADGGEGQTGSGHFSGESFSGVEMTFTSVLAFVDKLNKLNKNGYT